MINCQWFHIWRSWLFQWGVHDRAINLTLKTLIYHFSNTSRIHYRNWLHTCMCLTTHTSFQHLGGSTRIAWRYQRVIRNSIKRIGTHIKLWEPPSENRIGHHISYIQNEPMCDDKGNKCPPPPPKGFTIWYLVFSLVIVFLSISNRGRSFEKS